MTRFLNIFAVLLGSTALASAYTNIVEDGTYQPVTNDWNVGGLEIVVGELTAGNTLDIYSRSTVSNAASVTVGRDAAADDNALIVENASLISSGELKIGDQGSGNYLEISDGGYMENTDAWVGAQAGANSNGVSVSESGVWKIDGNLMLNTGISNSVSVSSGGEVLADQLLINGDNDFNLNDGGVLQLKSDFDVSSSGFNWNDGGHFSMTNGTLTGLTETNGSAYLTGSRDLSLNDSVLDLSGADLTVGLNGSNSFIVIENGSVVTSDNGIIGSGEGADNNLVYVDGAGSVWRNNSGSLDMGFGAGEENSLILTNGAWTFVGDVAESDLMNTTTNGGIAVASSGGASMVLNNSSYVETEGGLFVGSTNGMTGTVTVQSNSTLNAGTLTIEDGSTLNLKETGAFAVEGDFAYGDDASKFVWENNTTLSVGGSLTKSNGIDGVERTLILDGGDWSPAASAVLTGVSNTLVVANGTQLETTDGVVSGTNNAVTVSGTGAHWDNAGTLMVTDSNNTIAVSGGGKVSAGEIKVEDGNTFTINSGGTLAITSNLNWSATSNVTWNSGGNLSVEGTLTGMDTVELGFNGVETNAVYLGSGRDLTLNNGEWLNGDTNLVVGYSTSGASVAITNGTKVVSADGYIGWGSSAAGNSVVVSDLNSVWANTGGDLYVGAYWDGTTLTKSGSGNLLTIDDGGQVFVGEATNGVPGMLVASSNDANLTIWGGSVVVDDTLMLGLSSNVTGSATIKSGGYLSVGDLVIADTNSMLDLQSGGTFDIRTDFDVATWETGGFSWGSNSTLSVGGTLSGKTSDLSEGQDLILDGSNAVWDITGEGLEIGLDGESVLTLLNGASMTNANTIIGTSTNTGSHGIAMNYNSYWKSTGDLMIGPATADNYLWVYGGSTNELDGSAYIGGTNTSDNYAQIAGSNSLWSIGGNLDVGSGTGSVDNVLYVSDYAQVSVGSNVVVHSGNGVQLGSDGGIDVDGNFTVYSNAVVGGTGTITLNTDGTALQLIDGNANIASTIVFQGQGANMVDVDGGYFIVDGSNAQNYIGFQTLEMDDATLYGYGTNDAFSTVKMTGGTIAPSAEFTSDGVGELVITGNFESSNTTYFAQVVGDFGSDLLIFDGGEVDLTGMVARVVVGQVNTNSTTILTSSGGLANNFASNSIINNLLLFDADLQLIGNDVNVVISTNGTKFSSSLDYAGTESIRAGFGGMKNAVFTRTKQLRRNLVSTAHAIPHDAFLMTNTNAPAGAQGPGGDNTIFDMHVWMQYFNGQGTFDQQGNSYGFDLNNGGTTIGADRLVGDDLTVGFNYTYTRGDARTTNNDFLDTETYWLGLYGEWVGENGIYVDALAAYGRSNYDSVRVETTGERNYRGTSSYRGDSVGGYIDLGQYYYYKNLSLAPYAGLHLLTTKTDDHIEDEEEYGSQIKVHGLTRNVVESALGLKGRYRFDTAYGRFQATGYAEWTHDFVQDDVYTTMTGLGINNNNLPAVDMARITPEADVINAGLGLSWICTDYMEIGVGYNTRVSENYEEHSGSLMLDVMF